MKINRLILFSLIFICTNCGSRYYSNINRQKIVWELPDDTCNLIRYDGLYNAYDTSIFHSGERLNEILVTDGEVIFFKNGKVINFTSGIEDSAALDPKFYKRFSSKKLGKYTTKDDSIFVYAPISLFIWGMRLRLYYAHYSGYIKNRDTILNWKMIPPYPDVNLRLNDYLKEYTTPKMLYFIKTDAIRSLDSISAQ